MACVGAILLSDSEGGRRKHGGSIKRLISSTRKHTNVLRGELLAMKQDSQYNFSLIRDAKICLNCSDEDVAYLSEYEFHLLEAVNLPIERLDAFSNKLEWGIQLQQEEIVYVTIAEGERVKAMVKYKGEIQGLRGIHFGVEILVRDHS